MYHIIFEFGYNTETTVKIPLKHVKKTDFVKYSKAVIKIDFEAVFKRIIIKYNYWQDDYTLNLEYIDRIRLEPYLTKVFQFELLKDCLAFVKKER